jgi:hypothetical protein
MAMLNNRFSGFYISRRFQQRLLYRSPIEFEEKCCGGQATTEPAELRSGLRRELVQSAAQGDVLRGEVRRVRCSCPTCRPAAAGRPAQDVVGSAPAPSHLVRPQIDTASSSRR